jgi:rRNA biogenesis protein RRP5
MQILDKVHHIDVICKFAVCEYKAGHLEHGRTLIESVVANYPKRTDLWSVYLDQELKVPHNQAGVRYERTNE